jgi:allose kinase
MEHFIIGMDIGGTNIRIGTVSKDNQVFFFKKVLQKEVFINENSIELLIRFLEEYMHSSGLMGKIDQISIGLPAIISSDGTTVLQAPNLIGFDSLDIVTPLEKHFGIKTVLLKDVWAAVLYDMDKYQLKADGIVMACYIGTGIGNVMVLDGKILKGKNGVSGELGHIPVKGNHMVCGCGNVGCLENLAGGKYLAAFSEEKQTDITTLFIHHSESCEVDDYLDNVAIAISTEINIMDPNQVILGGGVLQMDTFPREVLVQKVRKYTRKPFPEKNLQINFVEDDLKKGVIGAALYAMKGSKIDASYV